MILLINNIKQNKKNYEKNYYTCRKMYYLPFYLITFYNQNKINK